MPLLILIMGDLAAGKSTFAFKLGEILNIPYFTKDEFKERITDAVGFHNREENKKISVAAFYSMEYLASRLMERKLAFILESNFKQEELNKYQVIIDKYQYQVLTIVLNADIEIIHERYLNRIQNHRHLTHLSNDYDLTNKEEFKLLIKQMREVKPIGKSLYLDTSLLNEKSAELLIKKIVLFVKENRN